MAHSNGKIDKDEPLKQSQDEELVTLLDIALIVVRHRGLIAKFVFAFGVLGLLIALFLPREYTSSARVIRELEAEGGTSSLGGLSFLRGFGVNVGGGAAGLTPDAYPDIVEGREVRLAVVRDTFYFPDLERSMTFVEYANQAPGVFETVMDYTIRLPWTLKKLIAVERSPVGGNVDVPDYPTKEEEEALQEIAEMINTSIDNDTGLMTIAVTSTNPLVSAMMTQSLVDHLVERVREIRTQKARASLDFIQEQFREAEQELRMAENELAEFEDRNTNPQRARLLTEKARLQRQVSFKSELYSDLQAQYTQAQINFQRSEPVITLLERPVLPLEPSGSSRVVTVIWSMILGGIFGVGMAFVRWFLIQRTMQAEERAKIDELRETMQSMKWLRRLKLRKSTPISD